MNSKFHCRLTVIYSFLFCFLLSLSSYAATIPYLLQGQGLTPNTIEGITTEAEATFFSHWYSGEPAITSFLKAYYCGLSIQPGQKVRIIVTQRTGSSSELQVLLVDKDINFPGIPSSLGYSAGTTRVNQYKIANVYSDEFEISRSASGVWKVDAESIWWYSTPLPDSTEGSIYLYFTVANIGSSSSPSVSGTVRAIFTDENTPKTLSSISISGNSSIASGASSTYTCTASYSNGTSATVNPTWTISSGSSYANVTSSGVVSNVNTSSADKTFTLKATYTEDGVEKTATKAVTAAKYQVTVSKIEIYGNDTIPFDGTASYSCKAWYSDGTTATVQPSWSLSSTLFATVNQSGKVTNNWFSNSASSYQTLKASYSYGGITQTAEKRIELAAFDCEDAIKVNGVMEEIFDNAIINVDLSSNGDTPWKFIVTADAVWGDYEAINLVTSTETIELLEGSTTCSFTGNAKVQLELEVNTNRSDEVFDDLYIYNGKQYYQVCITRKAPNVTLAPPRPYYPVTGWFQWLTEFCSTTNRYGADLLVEIYSSDSYSGKYTLDASSYTSIPGVVPRGSGGQKKYYKLRVKKDGNYSEFSLPAISWDPQVLDVASYNIYMKDKCAAVGSAIKDVYNILVPCADAGVKLSLICVFRDDEATGTLGEEMRFVRWTGDTDGIEDLENPYTTIIAPSKDITIGCILERRTCDRVVTDEVENEIKSLLIVGSATIANGSEAAYTCKATMDDGTTCDVTDQVSWKLNSTAYSELNGATVINSNSGNEDKSVVLTASYGGLSSDLTIVLKGEAENDEPPAVDLPHPSDGNSDGMISGIEYLGYSGPVKNVALNSCEYEWDGSNPSSIKAATSNAQAMSGGTGSRNASTARTVSSTGYKAGSEITVTVQIPEKEGMISVFIGEIIPAGWTVSNKGGGTLGANGILKWSFEQNIPASVSYSITAPADSVADSYVLKSSSDDTGYYLSSGSVVEMNIEDTRLTKVTYHPSDLNGDNLVSGIEYLQYSGPVKNIALKSCSYTWDGSDLASIKESVTRMMRAFTVRASNAGVSIVRSVNLNKVKAGDELEVTLTISGLADDVISLFVGELIPEGATVLANGGGTLSSSKLAWSYENEIPTTISYKIVVPENEGQEKFILKSSADDTGYYSANTGVAQISVQDTILEYDVEEEIQSYSVTVKGGAVDGTVSEFKPGTTVTVRADSAAEGKKFDSWLTTPGNLKLTKRNNGTWTFVMPAETVVLEAKFADVQYSVRISNAIGNGSIQVDKTTAIFGETVTLSNTPDAGYKFSTYLLDGEIITGNSFEMPARDVVVSAEFTDKPQYHIVVENGKASRSALNKSESVVLTADDRGMQHEIFNGWVATGFMLTGEQKLTNPLTITMPDSDPTTEQTFTFKATYVDEPVYSVTINDVKLGDYYEGDVVEVCADEPNGWEKFAGWTSADVTMADATSINTSFVMPAANVSLSYGYENNVYTVTLHASRGEFNEAIDGWTIEGKTATYEYDGKLDSAVTLPSVTAEDTENYEFSGTWRASDSKTYTEVPSGFYGNLELTAQFKYIGPNATPWYPVVEFGCSLHSKHKVRVSDEAGLVATVVVSASVLRPVDYLNAGCTGLYSGETYSYSVSEWNGDEACTIDYTETPEYGLPEGGEVSASEPDEDGIVTLSVNLPMSQGYAMEVLLDGKVYLSEDSHLFTVANEDGQLLPEETRKLELFAAGTYEIKITPFNPMGDGEPVTCEVSVETATSELNSWPEEGFSPAAGKTLLVAGEALDVLFGWPAMKDVSAYDVLVFNSNGEQVAVEEDIQGCSATIPLEAGVYFWRVVTVGRAGGDISSGGQYLSIVKDAGVPVITGAAVDAGNGNVIVLACDSKKDAVEYEVQFFTNASGWVEYMGNEAFAAEYESDGGAGYLCKLDMGIEVKGGYLLIRAKGSHEFMLYRLP